MVALVALIVVLLPSSALVRTAVIEKASAAESPKEYYERIKNIPVDEITQEVEDISSDDGILKMLRQNPLLKGLAMFNEREVTDERWSSPQYYKKLDEKGESKNSQKSKTRSPLKRQKQKSLYDNFYEDYEKMNETYFNDGTSDEYEIRRTPTGRKLSDDIDESLGIEYDDEQPFAVTESLVKSLERANEAVVPVELDKLDGFHASFNNDVEYYGDISTGIVTTTQAPPTTSLLPTTTLLAPTTFGTYFSTAHISPPLANDEKLNDEKATTSRLQQTPLKKKVLPAPGLKKSEFQGVFYVVGMNNRFEVQKQAPQQLASILQKSHRSEKRPSLGKTDSMIVTPQKGGTFLVSGTRYYSDNRVDGEVHHAEDAMREKYRKRRTSKEELEMIKDPLYAVEVELSGMKSRKSGTTSAMEGTKLQSGKKKKKRSKKKQPEDAHDKARSTVTMMKVGEKVFEKRITDIGGHKVVVALGNKHLHGADLIARPGSVIHGRLPTGDEGVEALEKAKVGIRDLLIFPPSDGNHNHVDSFHNSLEEISDLGGSLLVQSEDALELPKELQFSDDKTLTKAQIEAEMIEMCFFVKTDTQLVGAAPIERTVGVSSTECIMQCARDSRCYSVNYSGSVSTCEIFDMSDGSVTTPRSRLGFTYYMPKQTDVQSCIDEVLSLHDPFSTSSEEGVTRCEANGTCKTTTLPVKAFAARRLLPSKAECSASSAVLFIRSAGLRDELGRNLDTVPDISEDDCLFSCLINKAADSEPISCVSAEYDAKKELCTLSSEARQNDLSVHPSSTIYEKICVAQSVAEQCSGAAVERIANTILIGYLRDSATTSGIEECIERCVRASTTLGFQCLSIMYFYDETILNCILNDASVRTNPEAISEEYSTTVDYFGVDDCYGLPEVSDSRQNFVRSYPILPATEKPSGVRSTDFSDNPPRLHRLSSTVHRRTRR